MLKKTHPNILLVPCFDIDLMWRSHQAHATNYSKDCYNFFGRQLTQDDSVNLMRDFSRLNVSFQKTERLWWNKFEQEYFRPGKHNYWD